MALLVFSPWMVRNYVWKQNPVYPLFDRVFHPPENAESEKAESQPFSIRPGPGVFVIREGIYHENWWKLPSCRSGSFLKARMEPRNILTGS